MPLPRRRAAAELRASRLERDRRCLPDGRAGLLLLPGAHRRHDHLRRLQHRRARGGGRPAGASGGGGMRRRRLARRGARPRGQGIRRAETRPSARRGHRAPAAGLREKQHRAVQVSARGGVRRRLAAHRDRQAAALQAEAMTMQILQRPGRMARSIVCRAVPPGAEKYPGHPGAGRRQARAPRAADLVRARQEGIPGVAAGAGRRLPRADGPALPDDGRGAGERPGGRRGAPGNRGHGRDPRGGRMKVSIIGGGPGGLYFALLAKKAWPRWEITLYERNRPDDTFGFGVVFSDQTLDTFKACDLVTYERIRRRFAYWGDVDVVYKGQVLRSGGNGFCGCSRVALLNILQDRARDLGVQMRFQREVDDLGEFADSDLVVIADGINSKIRSKYADHFQPSVDLRPNKFTWLGSTRPLDAFKYFFRETPEGIILAHCYQYET